MNNRYCLLDAAESRQYDGRSAIAPDREFLQECNAVLARHHEVGQDDAGRSGFEYLESFPAVGRGDRGKAQPGDHFGQIGALAGIVIHNQYSSRPLLRAHLSPFYPWSGLPAGRRWNQPGARTDALGIQSSIRQIDSIVHAIQKLLGLDRFVQ